MKAFVILVILAVAGCSQSAQNPSPSTLGSTTTGLSTTTTEGASTTTTASTTTPTAPTTTTSSAGGTLSILFVGNSHTSTHDIPRTVRELLDSDPARQTTVELMSAGFLRIAANDVAITDAIGSGDWDIVVLQGQEISQSHSIAYSQEEAVALAELAIESGARALLFSEWPRKGIDETEYIEKIYDEIAEASGAEVVPVGRTWDLYLADLPDNNLWASDGNHSNSDGAFLAAATLAHVIAGPDAGLTTATALEHFLRTARLTVESYFADG